MRHQKKSRDVAIEQIRAQVRRGEISQAEGRRRIAIHRSQSELAQDRIRWLDREIARRNRRVSSKDVSVEVIRPSGGLLVTAIVDDQYFKRRYFDYTKQEAVQSFVAEVNDILRRDLRDDGGTFYKRNPGARLRRAVYDYPSARAALDAGFGKRLAHNTRLEQTGPDEISVILHRTPIVTFHRDGTLTLNSGGYMTVTTKARMNEILKPRLAVIQRAGEWWVVDAVDKGKVRFSDGMRFAIR